MRRRSCFLGDARSPSLRRARRAAWRATSIEVGAGRVPLASRRDATGRAPGGRRALADGAVRSLLPGADALAPRRARASSGQATSARSCGTACSAGATGLVACDTTTDVFHPGRGPRLGRHALPSPRRQCTDGATPLPWLASRDSRSSSRRRTPTGPAGSADLTAPGRARRRQRAPRGVRHVAPGRGRPASRSQCQARPTASTSRSPPGSCSSRPFASAAVAASGYARMGQTGDTASRLVCP